MTPEEEISELRRVIAGMQEEIDTLLGLTDPTDVSHLCVTMKPGEWFEAHNGRVRIIYNGAKPAKIVCEAPRNFRVRHIRRGTV